jgi:hypothetical protein
VNLLAKDLKFPQPLRMSLAYDRQLPWNLIGTLEALYSRTLNQLFFVNLNVGPSTGVSNTGRTVLRRTPVNPANGIRHAARAPGRRGEWRHRALLHRRRFCAIQNKDYAYNLTAQLRKRYADNWEALVAYTFSRARDVQSFTSSTALSNAQFGRTLVGPQDSPNTGVSLFDQPHKINALVSRTFNWWRGLGTDVTMVYSGVSGAPHDYVYGSSGGSSSDLNADGYNTNDLFYVPRTRSIPAEIQFRRQGTRSPTVQAQDLENFIAGVRVSQLAARSHHVAQLVPQPFHAPRGPSRFASGCRLRARATSRCSGTSVNFGNLLNKNWGKAPVHAADASTATCPS